MLVRGISASFIHLMDLETPSLIVDTQLAASRTCEAKLYRTWKGPVSDLAHAKDVTVRTLTHRKERDEWTTRPLDEVLGTLLGLW